MIIFISDQYLRGGSLHVCKGNFIFFIISLHLKKNISISVFETITNVKSTKDYSSLLNLQFCMHMLRVIRRYYFTPPCYALLTNIHFNRGHVAFRMKSVNRESKSDN